MTEQVLFRESCEGDGDDFPLADTDGVRALMQLASDNGAIAVADAAQKLQDKHKSGHKLTLCVSPATLTPAGMRAYAQLAALGLVSERSELIADCPLHSRTHDAAAWQDAEWRQALADLASGDQLKGTRGVSLDCPTECDDDELMKVLQQYK